MITSEETPDMDHASNPEVTECPTDEPVGGADLTARQSRIVSTIRDFVARNGYPPSMREVGQAVGLASTSSVAYQLQALEKKGVLRRDPHRPRAYVVPTAPAGSRSAGGHPLSHPRSARGPHRRLDSDHC
ncbi:hypothetical protein GCM10020000_86230 [Streptomyces olivoverticillatus]